MHLNQNPPILKKAQYDVTTSNENKDGNRQPVNPQAAAPASAVDSGPISDRPLPRVSFAIPVRNGERFLGRALDSLLAQDFDDFEIVVCDNASTDETPELMRVYAERDRRLRCVLNEEDIDQIENFNWVYELSRGEFFCWMGADDDWLETAYARKCVAVLDPIYSLIRRDALQRTGLLPINPWTDRLLAVERRLLGSFCHLDDCLSTRPAAFERWKERLPRYHERLGRKRDHRMMLFVGCAKIV